jgi:hypothetical protein
MHFLLLLAIVLPATLATLPVKIIAIAGFAYILIAALKKAMPSINGWYALALNVAFSLAGTVMVAKPGDFSDPTFWATLIAIIASASGIQGTVKASMVPKAATDSATGNNPASGQGNASNTASMKGGAPGSGNIGSSGTLGLVVLFLCFALTGCKIGAATPPPPPAAGAADAVDSHANQVLQTIHAFLAKVSADVLSGAITLTQAQRNILDTANKATNAADIAEQAYHAAGGLAGGGNQAVLNSTLTSAQSAFNTAQASIASGITK